MHAVNTNDAILAQAYVDPIRQEVVIHGKPLAVTTDDAKMASVIVGYPPGSRCIAPN